MDKYVIIKLEEKEFAKTYDDIKEDKYLYTFKLIDGNPYPYKCWTSNLNMAIKFFDKENAQCICKLLRVNTPWPLRVELIND